VAGRTSKSTQRRAQQGAVDRDVTKDGPDDATKDTGVGIAQPRVQTAPIKIDAVALAAARRRPRQRSDQKVSPLATDYQPFLPAEHPPGVGPQGNAVARAGMAADDALSPVIGWANQNILASAWLEGQVFLGYSELSILAQRPEYRVVSEEIASEMTREWIEFESSGNDEKTKIDKADKI
jgi:hypothetical protein